MIFLTWHNDGESSLDFPDGPIVIVGSHCSSADEDGDYSVEIDWERPTKTELVFSETE